MPTKNVKELSTDALADYYNLKLREAPEETISPPPVPKPIPKPIPAPAPVRKSKIRFLETDVQKAICKYLAMQYPKAWEMTCASPAGMITSKILGGIAVGLGYKKGFPDLAILHPITHKKGLYHGLFLEVKKDGGGATAWQRDWIEKLRQRGYQASVVYGFDDAKRVIDTYMKAAL